MLFNFLNVLFIMFVILVISMATVVNCLEPKIENDINQDIKNIIAKYVDKIPDVKSHFVINNGLSRIINHYFKGKITTFPLYKISLSIDRNPVKIPWQFDAVESKEVRQPIKKHKQREYRIVLSPKKLVNNKPEATKLVNNVPEATKLVKNEIEATKLVNNVPQATKLVKNETEATKLVDNETEATKLVDNETEATKLPIDLRTSPKEFTTLPTELTTLPTELTTLPTELTTLPTDLTTPPTEMTTPPTQMTTPPTEMRTVKKLTEAAELTATTKQ